ncbi:MAG TPA: acetamidase/formamidase family protein [Atribacterota bacterium]|nr:acetamidase/formamidase family protein [Atribacterota bacterium]
MKILTRDKFVFAMGTSHEPVLKVDPGESLQIETEDCFSYLITEPDDSVEENVDFAKVNPATGPIFVNGAQPGDLLKVTIKNIEPDVQGVSIVMKGLGVLGHKVENSQVEIIPIKDGYAEFAGQKLACRPMIGVIGVAPAEGEVLNGTPGDHGGNMDTVDVCAGSTIYLPVFVEGAYFALGDAHAVMGNGEVCGTGVECRSVVDLTIDIDREHDWRIPVIETEDNFYFVGSGETLDRAVEKATDEAVAFLAETNKISWNTAYMLASLALNVIVSQAVNPLKTARVQLPKSLLKM